MSKIPGFEIIEKLGQGGMATVWKARQISLDRIVAIKILSAKQARDEQDVKRFQAEAQQAAKLKHQGIVQVYDANVIDGSYYFVMEYVSGYTVGDWLRRKRRLTEKDALLVGECVADALSYAWDNAGIIHCDVKPDNVIIDSDGTVKVADLGLARTINAMSNREAQKEVMGTPAYMSPEQARGEPDLDFRADIYSLGAMMYHMVTGELLFQGENEDQIMELQVNGTVKDLIDFGFNLSMGMGWLLERMLAKNKNHRQSSWGSVRSDVNRIKRKMMPQGPMLKQGLSTMRRSKIRTKMEYVRSNYVRKDLSHESSSKRNFIVGSIFAGLILIVYLMISSREQQRVNSDGGVKGIRPLPVSTTSTTTTIHDTMAEESIDNAKEAFEYAMQWATQNPDKFDRIIQNFSKVAEETRRTKYSLMAETELAAWTEKRRKTVSDVLRVLELSVAPLIAETKYDEAADAYDNYDGQFADETQTDRLVRANELRRLHQEYIEKQKRAVEFATKKKEEILNEVVALIVTKNIGAALEFVRNELKAVEQKDLLYELTEISGVLEASARMGHRILSTFEQQLGKELTIRLNSGPVQVVVVGVRNDQLEVRPKSAIPGVVAVVRYSVEDLAIVERLQRMGDDTLYEVALAKGVMALNSKAYSHAKKYFGGTHPLLSVKLVEQIDALETKKIKDDAINDLQRVMQLVGVAVSDFDAVGWVNAIEQQAFDEKQAAAVLAHVQQFEDKYGTLSFLTELAPVLTALRAKGVSAEERSVHTEMEPALARGEASNILEEVIKKMMEVNIGLRADHIEITFGPNWTPESVRLSPPGAIDVSPLAKLRTIKELVCVGSWRGPACNIIGLSALSAVPLDMLTLERTMLSDLSQLEGMKLRELNVNDLEISNLAPLKLMPLEKLAIKNSAVNDLLPLTGMNLRYLDISGIKAHDFGPIADMPLEFLALRSTQIKDISILKNMPLRHLDLSETKIFDFSALRNMPLNNLYLNGTQIKDLSILHGMLLRDLEIDRTNVSDISPLIGMRLTGLSLSGTSVRALDVIAGMPLRYLRLADCKISDLSVLAGMPLTELDISNTGVSDLAPLKDMQLRKLSISGTHVNDLTVLKTMPLEYLACVDIRASDYSPLIGMGIERIYIGDSIDDRPNKEIRKILWTMPNLRLVNTRHWKR
ncbi:MAG: protein kinase [Lentisphaerae bacterium]|nr:protein kinase [Lentisphaerota bacterium]